MHRLKDQFRYQFPFSFTSTREAWTSTNWSSFIIPKSSFPFLFSSSSRNLPSMNSVNHLIINPHLELFFFHHPSENTMEDWSSSKILEFTHSPSWRFSESLPHDWLISSAIIDQSFHHPWTILSIQHHESLQHHSSINHSFIHHVDYSYIFNHQPSLAMNTTFPPSIFPSIQHHQLSQHP
jgi:hypothetical protein